MAINFCINCGEKLEEGATVCAACGEPVPVLAADAESADAESAASADNAKTGNAGTDNAKTENKEINSYADFTGFDILTSDPGAAPPERIIAPPDRTDVMAPVKGMRSASEFRAPQDKKSHMGTLLKAAIGVAAAILVVAGIGLLAQPETQENLQQQLAAANSARNSSGESSAETSENPAESGTQEANTANKEGTSINESNASSADSGSSVRSSLAVSDAAAHIDDDTAFEILTATYDGLQSYNERVYSCLQTYNGVFVAADKTQREAAAGIATALLGEIEQDIKTLDSMNIGRASALYDDYEKVRHLLEDQYNRLATVVESWEISLSYDAPYEHQDEILEPLRRDTGPTGQNKYLEDFDANYWNSRPTRS